MLHAPLPQQIRITKPSKQSERALIYRISGEAFEKIHQHRTPPDPVTYSVWYAYASNSPAIVTTEIDELLSRGDTLSPDEIYDIYQAYIFDSSPEIANQYIGLEFESNLSEVTSLLSRGMSENADFKATLDDVEGNITEVSSSGELQGVLTKLINESQRMARVSTDITKGLQESQDQVKRLNSELERVRKQSMCDSLTEVANRRAFDRRIVSEIERSEKDGSVFCLVLADIDEFKSVNDTYGHQAGDAILKMFAAILMENTKGHDLVARIGGDEFAVILPETSVISAYNLMVDIKSKFKASEFVAGNLQQKVESVSSSFGISLYSPGRSVRDMVDRADTYLYQAKMSGRNRVKAENIDPA